MSRYTVRNPQAKNRKQMCPDNKSWEEWDPNGECAEYDDLDLAINSAERHKEISNEPHEVFDNQTGQVVYTTK